MKKRILCFLLFSLLLLQAVPALAAGAVQLDVPAQLSIDGKTFYELSYSEYFDLLLTVHDSIQAELNEMCLGFIHYESIEANDGCTVFTVTVNSTAYTAEEKAAENRMYEMREQMAAYLSEKVEGIRVEYKNMKGDLLWTSELGVPQILAIEETVPTSGQSQVSAPVKSAAAAQAAPAQTPLPTKSAPAHTYILNTNTHKFHYPDCKSVKQMKEKNKSYFEGTRDEVIAMGYDPCGNCHP